METSALNKAHQQHRLADNHLRYRRFSEAIACHKNAVDLLSDALNCTDNPRSLDSIKLQIDFHGRQRNIINMKKEQHEHYKLTLDNKFCNIRELSYDEDNDGNMLTVAIYQTIEETDSLIEIIEQQQQHSDISSAKSFNADTENNKEHDEMQYHCTAVKHPKDDKTVIEEFKILNKQLHLLVSQLVNQLESSKKENDALKTKLKQYEYEKVAVQNNQNQSNSLKVNTDSSGGTSPFVFSPCSEFSPEVQEHSSLPLLAIPSIKFTTNNLNSSSGPVHGNDT